jgi:cysteine desulfurase family protein (TIGR01976 family)
MNDQFRSQFPALARLHQAKSLLYFDGPAGTQVPQSVIDAVSDYYKTCNANTHGAFLTTHESDDMIHHTREAAAALLGAEEGHTISFGQNMTTLNFSLSRAIGRVLQPGDEVLITQLDHEANRGPWLALREQGIVVREIKLRMDGTLNLEDLEAKLNHRTRLVAMGHASNIFGTVNDVAHARRLTYEVGAWLLVDAVHYAPHFPVDVQALGCDFLLCSAYKFYGPHVGLLYCKPGLLDRLPTDRLRTAYQHAPYSIETGTLNHAAIAGVKAAIEFIASQGKDDSLRERLLSAYGIIGAHEAALAKLLYSGLSAIPAISVKGPGIQAPMRAPTFSFTFAGKRPEEVCEHLAARNIFAWDGHFYAIRATEVMGLLEQGGVTRVGVVAYNTREEVELLLSALDELG